MLVMRVKKDKEEEEENIIQYRQIAKGEIFLGSFSHTMYLHFIHEFHKIFSSVRHSEPLTIEILYH